MNILLICLITTASIVFIYDYTAFPRNFSARIMTRIRGKEVSSDRIMLPKILECSLCASVWLTLTILLLCNWKLAPFCLLFGWSTKHILRLYGLIDLLLDRVYKYLYEKISNIK